MQTNTAYKNRLHSIDILRGLALILMVLDHTRDFFGSLLYGTSDLGQVSAGVFLSRWVTHLCAPTFVFLAGVSAYLYGLNHTKKELTIFLLTRGIWLIFLELTVITFAWKFTLDATLVVQVIYALGFSMMILAGLIWLPKPILLIFSLLVISLQQWLTMLMPTDPYAAKLFSFIYGSDNVDIAGFNVTIFYSVIPWFAVMSLGYCLGYCLGYWFKLPAKSLTKRFIVTGIACLTVFFALRYFNYFGNPTHWSIQSRGDIYTVFSFINVDKYPASFQFLLLTLGIIFLLIPLFNTLENALTRFLLVFGKVSLFFYIIHLNIIHLCAYFYSYVILGAHPEWWWGPTSPWITNHYPTPENYHFHLGRVYFVTLLVLLISYPLCKAYGRYKSTHKYKWLSYL